VILAVALVGAATLGACAPADSPTLAAVTPARGTAGATIVLTGEGFCSGDCETAPVGAVDFGIDIPQTRAVVLAWDDARIEAIVPPVDPGETIVLVTANDRTSNAVDFEVLP
jgi:hypothetical protein